MKKNPMKIIKQWLSAILTALVVGVLFAVIFIEGGFVTPSPTFFKELLIVCCLTFMMKLWWYDYAEDKRLNEQDIADEKKNYFKIVDDTILDIDELDAYLKILNQENREHYIKNKLGSRTAKTLAIKNWFVCLFHPSWRALTKEEIGHVRYDKLYYRIQRRADNLREVKSEEIIALTTSEMLYDSKNYLKQHKRTYQIVTTVVSLLLTTALASMALESLMLSWINVFKYITYLCSLVFTIAWTVLKAYRQTGDDTFDHLNRLKFIVDKYATYKEKEETSDDRNA
jgi:amino acid permease